jgi:squalene synthase HpnC
MLSELQAADAYCRYLANRHYENFSVAATFLPAELRLHLARIYAFCRGTDDLGDESGPHAEARLLRWRQQVCELFEGGPPPIHPVLLALSRTVERYQLTQQPFLDLIDANLQDQRVHSYGTWRELLAYCMLSAAPVGRMVLGVFEVRDPEAVALSDDVCIGLQLANFAQDVTVDRGKGRSYLIESELQHGVRAAVREHCRRAEALLASGERLETMVPGRLRVQLALYRLGGLAIIAAIERMDYATDRDRPVVSPMTKLRLVPSAVVQSTRGERDVKALRTPATRL